MKASLAPEEEFLCSTGSIPLRFTFNLSRTLQQK